MEEFISEKATRRQQYDTEKVRKVLILFIILSTIKTMRTVCFLSMSHIQYKQNAFSQNNVLYFLVISRVKSPSIKIIENNIFEGIPIYLNIFKIYLNFRFFKSNIKSNNNKI